MMLTVIADDITGAAEIAGIGFRFGLRTSLLTAITQPLPDCDILVVATDTRSMTEEEAVAETRWVVRRLQEAGAMEFFKKTDSALRGHVVPELHALLEETSYTQVLYLPENPSKGRTVREGVYYIGNVPLHETSFASDPEFPAMTSVVTERMSGMRRWETSRLASPASEVHPMYVADAETVKEVDSLLSSWDVRKTLLAGAADLFTAYLRIRFAGKTGEPRKQERDRTASSVPEFVRDGRLYNLAEEAHLFSFSGLQSGKALVVCGSTLSTSLAEQPYIRKHAIPIERMPEEVFEGRASAAQWSGRLVVRYEESRSLVLTIGYPSAGGKSFALRLRTTMAEVTEALVREACPDELIIEGGATAFSILKRLGWESFLLTDEVAPGVVRMCRTEHGNVHVTLKPGSYPWGELFK